jgi:outer membrane protein OmpA-like peptidoglycan-associated protein
VARDETAIMSRQYAKGDLVMTAPRGTVLEVIGTEGDLGRHLPANWYWVVLPRDARGTRRAGWISGRDVESVPLPVATKVAPESDSNRQPDVGGAASDFTLAAEAPLGAPGRATATDPVSVSNLSEVVVNFAFGKSDLSAEARGKLADAVAMLKSDLRGLSFLLEGHADWVGTEAFNERLGLARAEAVKRYLTDHHQIPAERISVISFGEGQPAASNATRNGRAQNRRVVVKVRG